MKALPNDGDYSTFKTTLGLLENEADSEKCFTRLNFLSKFIGDRNTCFTGEDETAEACAVYANHLFDLRNKTEGAKVAEGETITKCYTAEDLTELESSFSYFKTKSVAIRDRLRFLEYNLTLEAGEVSKERCYAGGLFLQALVEEYDGLRGCFIGDDVERATGNCASYKEAVTSFLGKMKS